MRNDDPVRPSLLDGIHRLAAKHEAPIMLMTCRMYHIILRLKTVAMHRAAGRTKFIMFVKHRLCRKPLFAPAALNAVVVHIRDDTSSSYINHEGINKVAKVRMTGDANNALRKSSGPNSGLLN